MRTPPLFLAAAVVWSLHTAGPAPGAPEGLLPLEALSGHAPTAAETRALAEEFDTILLRDELPLFYPGCLDREHGGFRHAEPEEWKKLPPAEREKNLVFQARMVWTAAEVARRRPDLREEYLAYARHGFRFLKDHFWDSAQGGFYGMVGESGGPSTRFGGDKFAYGISFGIYACAGYFRVSDDPEALALALDAFRWMERHARDKDHGGYYEAYEPSGAVLLDAARSCNPQRDSDQLGTRYGLKSMNAHIHLMEALTELYQAGRDPRVRVRLEELFHLVRDVITVDPPGAMNQFFAPDWKPLPFADSFGHDVETTYLLLETAEALGLSEDDARTFKVARRLTDHALRYGWDSEQGGFWEEGNAFGPAHTGESKIWWSQAEGLNSLLLLYERTGELRYWNDFVKLWGFVRSCGIDFERGGWRFGLNPVQANEGWKVHPWKTAYHSGRAMLNVADRLRNLESAEPGP